MYTDDNGLFIAELLTIFGGMSIEMAALLIASFVTLFVFLALSISGQAPTYDDVFGNATSAIQEMLRNLSPSFSNSSFASKALADTIVNSPDSNSKVYYLAYINDVGEIQKYGGPMNFFEAITAIGAEDAIYSLSQKFSYKGDSYAK